MFTFDDKMLNSILKSKLNLAVLMTSEKNDKTD